ncbi:putative methyltransferase-domain-containing protein [Aspergillus avenaceus]|uniref:Protein-lysine N-methyltransferase EFM6 n=1 Tax=Aspergillus avenaceus TaxID=36643 RepID=A0A5N6TGS7_ASPAV|nr:putative methyltransferase-domain-containing protein [Aspergillus avenaceus]
MDKSDLSNQLLGVDGALNISESLVPVRNHKGVACTEIAFDGFLKEPLVLREDLKEGCGGQLWPAGMVLAKYLLRQHKLNFLNKTVVELGAGGGLVGLAVARGCNTGSSTFYITDQAPMRPLMETNIKLNNLSSSVSAAVLNWGEPLPDSIPEHPAIVLAADCVYFEPAFPLLISTLRDLLGPESICYFCFKRRRRADLRFMKQARKVFEIEEIRDDPSAETYRRENIFLYSLRLKSMEIINSERSEINT